MYKYLEADWQTDITCEMTHGLNYSMNPLYVTSGAIILSVCAGVTSYSELFPFCLPKHMSEIEYCSIEQVCAIDCCDSYFLTDTTLLMTQSIEQQSATLIVAANISQPGQSNLEIKRRISTKKHKRHSMNVGSEKSAVNNSISGESPSGVTMMITTKINSVPVNANEIG